MNTLRILRWVAFFGVVFTVLPYVQNMGPWKWLLFCVLLSAQGIFAFFEGKAGERLT